MRTTRQRHDRGIPDLPGVVNYIGCHTRLHSRPVVVQRIQRLGGAEEQMHDSRAVAQLVASHEENMRGLHKEV